MIIIGMSLEKVKRRVLYDKVGIGGRKSPSLWRGNLAGSAALLPVFAGAGSFAGR